MKLITAIRLPVSLLAHILLQPDKVAHIYWGATIGLCGLWMEWWALAVVVALAALKELYDLFHPPNQCDVWDFMATMIGGAGSIALIIFRLHHA